MDKGKLWTGRSESLKGPVASGASRSMVASTSRYGVPDFGRSSGAVQIPCPWQRPTRSCAKSHRGSHGASQPCRQGAIYRLQFSLGPHGDPGRWQNLIGHASRRIPWSRDQGWKNGRMISAPVSNSIGPLKLFISSRRGCGHHSMVCDH